MNKKKQSRIHPMSEKKHETVPSSIKRKNTLFGKRRVSTGDIKAIETDVQRKTSIILKPTPRSINTEEEEDASMHKLQKYIELLSPSFINKSLIAFNPNKREVV